MAIPDFLRQTILVFDTETAQLHDHICEVGFSMFKNMQLEQEIGALIKPVIPIDPGAEAVHKISDRDVEDQPPFKQMAMWCYNILNSADIHCAYNYDYDRLVFENEFARYGLKFPVKPMIDPMIFFKKWNKFNKGKRLTDAAQRYGIEHIGAHRATNDSTVTGKLLFKMAATRTDFPKSTNKLLEVQRKLIQDQYEDYLGYCQRANKKIPEPPNYSFYEVKQ